MKIAILAAMNKELQLVKSLLNEAEQLNVKNLTVYHGKIGNHEVYLSKCGIGKVNSALNTFRIIEGVSPQLIINTGVAGGAGLPVGSLLIADRVAYDDVWCGPSTEYGEADGCPLYFTPAVNVIKLAASLFKDSDYHYGLICSGDKFISSAEEIAFIRSHFPDVSAVDMESASIAQTCYLTSTPFNIIRVVSDKPGEGENLAQYENFWTDAPQKTFSALKTIIENL
ncbi:MAG: 5'-methylthioadenosine/adenosylhomocysteine nucleosidase [Muribaculaceae bacterium]|nr:5'-methylthioadenosine/adenosylhomocysteine nucleosidase [Muribaculaceae bacterium]